MFFSVTTKLQFIKLTENGFAPHRATPYAAGYDLRSAYNYNLLKKSKILVKTDIAIKLPPNCYGRIGSRSGLALKHSVVVAAGIIDPDYTGNLCVMLFNHSNTDFTINKGDRIAQLICEVALFPEVVEVLKLDETKRGAAGFGSTGIV